MILGDGGMTCPTCKGWGIILRCTVGLLKDVSNHKKCPNCIMIYTDSDSQAYKNCPTPISFYELGIEDD